VKPPRILPALRCAALAAMLLCGSAHADEDPPPAPAPAQAAPAVQPDPQRAAETVFHAPEFWWKDVQKVKDPRLSMPSLDFLTDALRWLGRLLEWLFGDREQHPSSSSSLARYAAWALLAAIPLLLALRWRELQRWLGLGGRSRGAAPQATLEAEELPDARSLMAQAAAALAQGDAAQAVRLAFLAVIADLELQGLIPVNRARTNRQLSDALRRSPAAAMNAGFNTLALAYERVCYGRHPVGAAEAQMYLARCGELLATPRRPA
jgi:hypothetical protein